MEKSGITRRIDDLGRIVIPKEIRKNLKIRDSDEIEINVIDDKIVLNKYESLKKDKIISLLLYAINRYTNKNVLFTSREKVIDYCLSNKEVLKEFDLSNTVINIIDNRKMVTNYKTNITLFKDIIEVSYIISPIIINGDIVGSLILYSDIDIDNKDKEIMEYNQLFLENYLE